MKSIDVVRPLSVRSYQNRRAEFIRKLLKLDRDFVALVWSGSELTRNNDSNFPFRAHSDFLYLTGFSEPESMLAIVCKNGKAKVHLGLRPRDLSAGHGSEIWEGERVGVERAKKLIGVDEAFDSARVEEFIQENLKSVNSLMWRFGEFPLWDQKMTRFLSFPGDARKGAPQIRSIHSLGLVFAEMRRKKSTEEIEVMRKSAEIASRAHIRAMQMVRPGAYEYQVQAETEKEFRKLGAEGAAYTSICASGNNACTLHYRENKDKVRDGDLFLMDAGAELNGYASDITRCFPANGKFSETQKEVYEVVLKAQKAAIRSVKPGVAWNKAHDVAVRELSIGLRKWGFLKQSLATILKKKLWRKYMPHGTSHWLGLDVHDAGLYFDEKDRPLKLEKGNVLTVEPGLYFRADDRSVPARFRGIGIRIEDDVAVTATGHEVLSASCPKEIKEIEALRAPKL